MDFETAKADYDRDGFAIVRNFLSPDELRTLQQELNRYIENVVPTLDDAHAFYDDRSRPDTLKQMQHMECDSFFAAYPTHAKWKGLSETLVGETAHCVSPEWFDKPPGTVHVTPPHQDNYYFCLDPANVVTIWLALDHVDEANGCLRYLPGSHLRGFRPHARSKVLGFSQGITDYGDADFQQEVQIHLKPGDCVAHHGMAVHRAEANTSPDRHRRAFAMVYKGISCRRDENSYTRYQAAMQSQHAEMGLKTS